MRVENIVSFEQFDADEYILTAWSDDPEIGEEQTVWLMKTFEAVRLYQLLKATIGPHVAEMEAAKASYERGEGPNGEAPGTWEPQSLDAYRCVDPEGDWAEMMREQADLQRKAERENRA